MALLNLSLLFSSLSPHPFFKATTLTSFYSGCLFDLCLRLLVLATVPPKSTVAQACCESGRHPTCHPDRLPPPCSSNNPLPIFFSPTCHVSHCAHLHRSPRSTRACLSEHVCVLSDLEDLNSSSLQTSRCFSIDDTWSAVDSTCMVHTSVPICSARFSLICTSSDLSFCDVSAVALPEAEQWDLTLWLGLGDLSHYRCVSVSCCSSCSFHVTDSAAPST